MVTSYEINYELDILDSNEVYCTACIQHINDEDNTISVSYKGWGEEWNETIAKDSPRIAQDRKTVIAKAWVRLSHKFVYWPCAIYIRYPSKENITGEEYLKSERKIYLIPYGPECSLLRPYKHGVWINSNNITPFHTKQYDIRVQDGKKSNHAILFTQALDECLADITSIEYKFKLKGTFDIERQRLENKHLELPSGGSAHKKRKRMEDRQMNNISSMYISPPPLPPKNDSTYQMIQTLSSVSTCISHPNYANYYEHMKADWRQIHPFHLSILLSMNNIDEFKESIANTVSSTSDPLQHKHHNMTIYNKELPLDESYSSTTRSTINMTTYMSTLLSSYQPVLTRIHDITHISPPSSSMISAQSLSSSSSSSSDIKDNYIVNDNNNSLINYNQYDSTITTPTISTTTSEETITIRSTCKHDPVIMMTPMMMTVAVADKGKVGIGISRRYIRKNPQPLPLLAISS